MIVSKKLCGSHAIKKKRPIERLKMQFYFSGSQLVFAESMLSMEYILLPFYAQYSQFPFVGSGINSFKRPTCRNEERDVVMYVYPNIHD